MLVILVLLDISIMCVEVVVYTLLVPFSYLSICQKVLDIYVHFQSWLLKNLFGLSHMEIEGFRSQRTIQQFQLESIP